MKKILAGITILTSALMMSCSSGGEDETPINAQVIDESPKPKIHFYEDTVFINKSGGSSIAFLSYPNYEDIDVVNQNNWITISSFTNYYDDMLPTAMTYIGAATNTSARERIGYVYFRYKDEPYSARQELMDTLVVVQLASDSVITDNNKFYFFDEHASELAVFVPYSDYYTSVDDLWITETTLKRPDTPRCKFNFSIQELPDELDLRVSHISFTQPKDTKSVARTATIEQRRAIAIKNRVNVMKIDTEHQLELDLSLAVSGQHMIFKSSDESVATISNDGKIKALAKGNTLITIESEDGKHLTKMPLAVKTLLSQDENNVSIGMGIEIFAGTTGTGVRFFVSIENGSNQDIHLDKLTIKNNGEVAYFENSESVLGTLAAGQHHLLYFNIASSSYEMDCELQYTLDGKQFTIGEESGIVIQ